MDIHVIKYSVVVGSQWMQWGPHFKVCAPLPSHFVFTATLEVGETDSITSSSRPSKLKLRQVKWLAQNPSVSKRHSWDLNPGLLALTVNLWSPFFNAGVMYKKEKEWGRGKMEKTLLNHSSGWWGTKENNLFSGNKKTGYSAPLDLTSKPLSLHLTVFYKQ